MSPACVRENKKGASLVLIPNECKQCAGTSVHHHNILGNIFLAVFKGLLGVLSSSSGLIADAVHSSADVLDSFVTLIAVWIGEKPPDKRHPYGYGKIENISGVIVGCVLFFGSSSIIIFAFKDLISDDTPPIPHFVALMASFISILTNEIIYREEICAAQKVNSPALEAEAWDNRVDALSSVAVFLGLLGAHLGYPRLDPLAALIVGSIVLAIACSLIEKNFGDLMDIGLSADKVLQIRALVNSDPDVREIGYIRTRKAGRIQLIDLEILVNAGTSFPEANAISQRIVELLNHHICHLGNATVICRPQSERQV
ncbi:MAG: cation transporter [Candidatus Riflebacteria bacterium]|nr:cation transporter [Candidatus Riflebacteria bacterium]